MIGRTLLLEIQQRQAPEPRLVEVRRGDFSRLANGDWAEGDDEDIAARGATPASSVVAVIRGRVRAFEEDGRPLGGRLGFFGDQDEVVQFVEGQGARVLAAVEV